MSPISQEIVPFERDPRLRIMEAQDATREVLAPFAERVEDIKTFVGVVLREAARVRVETELPDGLAVEDESGGLHMPPDLETCDTFTVLRSSGQRKVRESAAEIGIGRVRDITLKDLGMSKQAQINLEGARIHTKFRTELEQALEEGEGDVVAQLTKHRELDTVDRENTRANLRTRALEAAASVQGDGEADAFARRGEAGFRHIEALRCLGIEVPGYSENASREALTGNGRAVKQVLAFLGVDSTALRTEYDGGIVEIMSHPDFIATYDPVVRGHLSIDGTPMTDVSNPETDRSLVLIGTIDGRGIYVQDVPIEYLFEDGGPLLDNKGKQQFVQPNAGQLLLGTATLLGNEEAVVATSNSYYPSRLTQVLLDATYRNELDLSSPTRRFGVIAYAPQRLARSLGTDPSDVEISIAHLLGEVKMADIELQEIDDRFRHDLEAVS